MQIDELKHMLKNSTAVLIMDNGEPSFVVVDYNTYRGLAGQGGAEEREVKVHAQNGSALPKAPAPQEIELLERINKDILALKAQIEDEEKVMTP